MSEREIDGLDDGEELVSIDQGLTVVSGPLDIPAM